jgi:CHAD domain-containing protein
VPRKRFDRGLNRRSPGGEVLVAYLAAQVDEILRQDLPVRLDGPGSLHKMRVATRRVRSALSTFRPLVDHGVTDPLRQELKWLAGQLGDARDAEVMRDRLHAAAQADGAAADHGPVDIVDSQLVVAYRRAHDHVLAELDGERYHALLGKLRALVEDPPFTADASRPAHKVLTKRVRRSWSRLKAIMDHTSKLDSGAERDEVLHEARKAAKRARYAGEALAPAFGADAERFAAAMENLQEVLGEHQDSVFTRQRLHELATVAPTNEAAFVYGRLHAIEEARAENAADAVREAWAKARRRRLRDWL